MQRILTFVALGLASALSFAQQSVQITTGSQKQYEIFESKSWSTKAPTNSQKLSGSKVEYKVSATDSSTQIYIIDLEAGNAGSKPANQLKDGLTITPALFNTVYKLEVEVSTPTGPIDSATVELQDGWNKREELLDPSSKGKATFYFAKFGEAKVTVNYRNKDSMATPVKQSFTLGADRKEATPLLKIALPDGNSTLTTAPAGTTEAKPKEEATNVPAAPQANPVGNLLTTLVGLGVVGAAAWWIIKYMRENGDKVQDTLTKLGADIPKPGAVLDPDPVPIQPIAPQPMQQIILDPAPVATIPSPAPMSMTTGIPKLVASDGSPFELPEGDTVVGREFGNGLVVPNDTVSRQHATLTKSGAFVSVTDHGSTNGTWVNGMKVSGSSPLSSGDSLRFGSIEYRYEG